MEIELLLEFVGDVLQALAPIVRAFFDKAFNDRSFQEGLLSALVIGFVSGYILYLRGRIMAYFSPTRLPATRPGPSPRQISSGCSSAALQLFFILIVFTVLLLSTLFNG